MISDKSQPVSAAGRCGALPAVRQAADVCLRGDPPRQQSRNGRPTRGTSAFYRKPEIRVSRKSVCGAVAVEGFC